MLKFVKYIVKFDLCLKDGTTSSLEVNNITSIKTLNDVLNREKSNLKLLSQDDRAETAHLKVYVVMSQGEDSLTHDDEWVTLYSSTLFDLVGGKNV